LLFGPAFGFMFALLSAIGLMTVYAFRLSPSHAYHPDSALHLRPHELIASALRGISTILAGLLATLVVHSETWLFAIEFGLVAGLVSAFVSIFTPPIEVWADHLPARSLGLFGTIVLLIGLLLQSVQYWVVLFNIVVK
jgi:hypothetical protein